MKLGIIGIGNTLMGDDGVGIALLEQLEKESLPEDISLIDIGAGGMNLLHALAKLDAAILLDAVDFGGTPGEARCLSPETLKSIKQNQGISTHEGDLIHMIELSRELGECPRTIIIFGVQPASMAPSMELSPLIEGKVPEFVKKVLETVRDLR